MNSNSIYVCEPSYINILTHTLIHPLSLSHEYIHISARRFQPNGVRNCVSTPGSTARTRRVLRKSEISDFRGFRPEIFRPEFFPTGFPTGFGWKFFRPEFFSDRKSADSRNFLRRSQNFLGIPEFSGKSRIF